MPGKMTLSLWTMTEKIVSKPLRASWPEVVLPLAQFCKPTYRDESTPPPGCRHNRFSPRKSSSVQVVSARTFVPDGTERAKL